MMLKKLLSIACIFFFMISISDVAKASTGTISLTDLRTLETVTRNMPGIYGGTSVCIKITNDATSECAMEYEIYRNSSLVEKGEIEVGCTVKVRSSFGCDPTTYRIALKCPGKMCQGSWKIDRQHSR